MFLTIEEKIPARQNAVPIVIIIAFIDMAVIENMPKDALKRNPSKKRVCLFPLVLMLRDCDSSFDIGTKSLLWCMQNTTVNKAAMNVIKSLTPIKN